MCVAANPVEMRKIDMMQPFFSVLVPVYNVKQYLDECVESLVGQSFPDYEVVLVDDGSTDGSGELCDAWAERFPERIRVVHQENQGLIMARGTGFRAAKGQVFVHVDSDDMLRSDALEVLHGYFTRFDADVVVFRISSKRDFSTAAREALFHDGEVLSVRDSQRLRQLLGASFRMNSLCSKAVKRSCVDIHRDYSAIRHIAQGEDLTLSLPMVDQAERVVYCDRILYYYRPNPHSLTNAYQSTLFRSMRDTLRIQRSYAEKWDPTGGLAQACDVNGLLNFYDVVVKITRSDHPVKKKREYLLEMVTDQDFLRDFSHIGQIKDRKVKYALILAKNRCFVPLYLFGALKRRLALRGR